MTRKSVPVRIAVLAGLVALVGAWTVPPARAEVQAGYDKGFFIKSDAFEAHFGARIQVWASSTEFDTFMYDSGLDRTIETERDNELTIRRFKFFGFGTLFNPSVKWKFQLDMERFNPGGSTNGNIRLEEAFFDFTSRPWTQLRAGQFKVPYGIEKMNSSGKLNLVDRSIVHTFFGIDQEPGADLYGQSFEKHFRYDVAVTTGVSNNKGFSTRNDLAADGDSDFRYMARLTWEPLEPYAQEQGSVTNPDTSQLTFQLGGQINKDTVPLDGDPFLPAGRILPFGRNALGANSPTFDADAGTSISTTISQSRKPYDRREVEAFVGWRLKRFAVEGQYITGDVDPEMQWIEASLPDLSDLTFDNDGARVQAGVFLIPTKLELAARWAMVDREAEADFQTTDDLKEEVDQEEWRVGLNWYFSKHDWKWQFDYGEISTEWKLNGTTLEVPERSQFPGPPPGTGFDNNVISRNERTDKEFRTQFQIQF